MLRQDTMVAFIGAVAVHCVVAVGAGRCLAMTKHVVVPRFREGVSSVALTLVQAPDDRPVAVTPPVRKDVAALRMVEEHPDLSVPRVAEKMPQPESERIRSDANADPLPKGVKATARAMTEVRPYYPLGARLRGEEGVVTVSIRVGSGGVSERVRVVRSSGFKSLDRAASDAASKTHYVTDDGRPASDVDVEISFRFTLTD